MTNYADSEFYNSKYHKIPQNDLAVLLRRANMYVDNLFINKPIEISDEVRHCVCEIAELYFDFESVGNGKIASENNDGYSVTFANVSTSDLLAKQTAIITNYLVNTGLLYRGIG